MRRLLGGLHFFLRFLPTFTAPAMRLRAKSWQPLPRLDGQTWLVTGASDGIGRAISLMAMEQGARVIGVARNRKALDELALLAPEASQFSGLTHDLSLMSEIESLSQTIAQGTPVQVLVNNVGVLLNEPELTTEGFEKSFATNLLGHYALTLALRQNNAIRAGGHIINMSSGGMYNTPLLLDRLNTTERYNGTLAYALQKRAQVVLNDHWRDTDPQRSYYVMHPGWVNTTGVQTSLPKFHDTLKNVLRTPREGADTAVWLGAYGPEQSKDGIWFDRKLRNAHIYKMTRSLSSSGTHLDSYLHAKLNATDDTDPLTVGPATLTEPNDEPAASETG